MTDHHKGFGGIAGTFLSSEYLIMVNSVRVAMAFLMESEAEVGVAFSTIGPSSISLVNGATFAAATSAGSSC